jgi:hypothetical protein
MGVTIRTDSEQVALDKASGVGGYLAVNESFFDTWTPEMAYVLGWIASDGSIVANLTGFHITSTDLDHLDNLRKLIGSTAKIVVYGGGKNRKKGGRLNVCRQSMVERLLQLGFTPRKSRTIRMPKVPDELFGHFLRGVFEGDGTVHIKSGKRMGIMGITLYSGSRGFLEDINQAIVRTANVKAGGLYHVDAWDMNELTFGGYDRCQALYRLMYEGVPEVMRLDRKWRKMHDYFVRGGAKLTG